MSTVTVLEHGVLLKEGGHPRLMLELLASHKEHIFLRLSTPRQEMELRVTPKGFIRVSKVERNRRWDVET